LQTSLYEGMSMSVIESMQMGLVPLVTPVGEIGAYCKQGMNAVIVESDQKAAEDILDLLNANDRYQLLRVNAIATWKDKPLYHESILVACKAAIHGGNSDMEST
jgi:glycosyltransferase involved in cell wall biosynthesis